MAKFSSYFGLCPLIEHNRLLGVSQDVDDGKVIVTLGKNMAMLYRLADQKQIIGWTTKEAFTSPVIGFSSSGNIKYAAAFNFRSIRIWDASESNLKKSSQLSFETDIYSLISIGGSPFVIFKNGCIVNLTANLETHRVKIVDNLKKNEHIVDVISKALETKKYIGLLLGRKDMDHMSSDVLLTSFNQEGYKEKFWRFSLKHNTSCQLSSISFYTSNNKLALLTLWSDGKLFIKNVNDESSGIGEEYSRIVSISCETSTSILQLNDYFVAIYGSNSNDEGALLMIYNMAFKVTQCKQQFKLLTMHAKIWTVGEFIVLPVGHNLAVVPYHLEGEHLSALVGSHKYCYNTKDADDVIVLNKVEEILWANNLPAKQDEIVSDLRKLTQIYLDQGLTESTIFENMIQSYIDSDNIVHLEFLLKSFENISERYFMKILVYFLEKPSNVFPDFKKHNNELYPEHLQPYKRYRILKLLLSKTFNEILLAPYIKTDLTLDNAITIIDFIVFELSKTDDKNSNFVKSLIDWMCLILDVNYLNFILSKNKRVLPILILLKSLVDVEISCLGELQKMDCLMRQIRKRKSTKISNFENYCIENINLL